MKFPSQPSFAILAGVTAKQYHVSVKAAEGDADAEILIHGPIGRSFWSEGGITGKDFTDALNQFPVGTKVTVGINSQGGAVGEGLAIYNAIKRRAEDITCRIDGYAISIASVIPLAAGKVISPDSAIWMIHNAWSWMEGGQGNAEDMRKLAELAGKAAEMLDKHDDVLVAAYVARSGKKDEEIRNAMAEETWLTGSEAVEWGLADEVSDDAADLEALDFSGMEAKAFKKIPLNCRAMILAASKTPNSALPPQGKAQTKNQTEENSMNRAQRIALLNGWGVMVKDEASVTDARLDELIAMGRTAANAAFKGEAAPAAAQNVIPMTVADVNNAVATAVQAAERRADCKASLLEMVSENRITKAQMDRVLKTPFDQWDTQIAALRENPIMPVAAEPVDGVNVEQIGDSVADCETAVKNLRAPIIAAIEKRQSPDVKAIQKNAIVIAQLVTKNLQKLRQAFNANNISADLKRNVILTQGMRAFKRNIVNLGIFSTRFNNIPLEGTNKIAVPYYPLDTAAANDFADGTGYEFNESSDTEDKDVTINKRKYKPFNFYSHQLARQPYFDVERLMMMKAEQLGIDVWTDVLSLFTLADYGAAVKAEAADTFDSDDVTDIATACDEAEWPDAGRALVLKSSYHGNLRKDPSLKNADKSGSDSTLREGSTGRVDRFDIFQTPRFPANGENLVGLAVLPPAALVATSPIAPGPAVRQQLLSYDVVVDPDLGISFEYRHWGNPDQDEEREVVECNYGYNKGQTEAAKRITS